QCCLDAKGTECWVLLQLADTTFGRQVDLADRTGVGARLLLQSGKAVLLEALEHVVDGRAGHGKVGSDAGGWPPLRVQRDDSFATVEGIGDLRVGREAACVS